MRVLAIDPGTTESGWVLYDTDAEAPVESGIDKNYIIGIHLMENYKEMRLDHMAIEMIASYGMPVGASTFETCCWIGEFRRCAKELVVPYTLVYRKDVKFHLCGSMKAKDGNIRQALIDRFSAGQGKRVAIGLKASPGPLYGFKSHMWAALAVAVTWADGQEG
jgi:hypothetical protein